jgi:thymidylate synthase
MQRSRTVLNLQEVRQQGQQIEKISRILSKAKENEKSRPNILNEFGMS